MKHYNISICTFPGKKIMESGHLCCSEQVTHTIYVMSILKSGYMLHPEKIIELQGSSLCFLLFTFFCNFFYLALNKLIANKTQTIYSQ